MSAMSEKGRSDAKKKVERLTSKNSGPVDASDYGEAPCGFMRTDIKKGNRPISKQNLATGGRAALKHGGRRSRDVGGNTPVPANSSAVAMPPQSRFTFGGSQASPLLANAGIKRGGKVKADGGGIHIKKSHEGMLHKELGVSDGSKIPAKKLEKAAHSSDPAEKKRAVFAENAKKWHHRASGGEVPGIIEQSGTRPTGGRIARAGGGKASKGKMNVNIIIAQKPDHPPMPPMGGAPMGGPTPPPPGAPMPPPGMPPQGMPPGANMPPPSMQRPPMPMGRKEGGKVYPKMEYSAANGCGRLEKARKY